MQASSNTMKLNLDSLKIYINKHTKILMTASHSQPQPAISLLLIQKLFGHFLCNFFSIVCLLFLKIFGICCFPVNFVVFIVQRSLGSWTSQITCNSRGKFVIFPSLGINGMFCVLRKTWVFIGIMGPRPKGIMRKRIVTLIG